MYNVLTMEFKDSHSASVRLGVFGAFKIDRLTIDEREMARQAARRSEVLLVDGHVTANEDTLRASKVILNDKKCLLDGIIVDPFTAIAIAGVLQSGGEGADLAQTMAAQIQIEAERRISETIRDEVNEWTPEMFGDNPNESQY